MKNKQDTPIIIFAACILLAMIFWLITFGYKKDDWVSDIHFLFFLPLTATPYIIWLMHKQEQHPDEHSDATDLWIGRFMAMIVVSVLSSVAAIIILGVFGYVYSFFE